MSTLQTIKTINLAGTKYTSKLGFKKIDNEIPSDKLEHHLLEIMIVTGVFALLLAIPVNTDLLEESHYSLENIFLGEELHVQPPTITAREELSVPSVKKHISIIDVKTIVTPDLKTKISLIAERANEIKNNPFMK